MGALSRILTGDINLAGETLLSILGKWGKRESRGIGEGGRAVRAVELR